MTLLAKKDGLSTADFRSYWAGPHAALALGMGGISKYSQNRVEKVLWTTGDAPRFNVDGIVELYFKDDEAMRVAQASSIGQRHIPADEPEFLRGWTLCIVDTEGEEGTSVAAPVKVIVPFLLGSCSKDMVATAIQRYASETGSKFALNWTASTARRERLWTEPSPPDGFLVLWFACVASAHGAFDQGVLCSTLSAQFRHATAYLIDELAIR
ncbi:EthD domain-containing protein [Variovorax sp. PBL-H6]|uniref:EthD domain-containing protein n=1 Tax=Variovorax sp. PBL-H6 TaxID=434009 RepID=UPI0013A57275|nr:EthD domain-containing protein [Variovorax sp. PBL-H6]